MQVKLPHFLLTLFCAALLALTAACADGAGPEAASPSVQNAGPDAAASSAPDPESTPTPEPVQTPEPAPSPEPSPEPSPDFPLYEFGAPLEESDAVEDDSYFDNAVFLGDSRTEGLQLFGGLKHGTYYWARGMNVFRADNDDYKLFDVDGEKLTLVGTLSKHAYDAVYIMIGINELGYPAERYEQGLGEIIDKVLDAQPEAVVYLQVMPPLNDAMCRANKLAAYINNDNLKLFNEALIRVAEEKRVVLLNTAEVYTGEDGQLPQELANDGCHFAYGAYTLWADYLRCHTIDPERYFYSREQAQ